MVLKAFSEIDNKNGAAKKPHSEERPYSITQYGIWEILMMHEGRWEKQLKFMRDVSQSFPSLCRIFKDIYSLSPGLLIALAICEIWGACREALKMHFSGKVLTAIEHCLKEGVADYSTVTYFVSLRLATAALASLFSWYSKHVLRKIRHRVKAHFELRIMDGTLTGVVLNYMTLIVNSARLQHNLTQSTAPGMETNHSADQVWQAFREVLSLGSSVMTVISQLTLILHLSRNGIGGPLFALLCFLEPVATTLLTQWIWSEVCIARQNDKDMQRIKALANLTQSKYRQDVISNHLRRFIIDEYKNANERLGERVDETAPAAFRKRDTPILDLFLMFLGELPMVYCAGLALLNPRHTSFANIAILQESASLLSNFVDTVVAQSERCWESVKEIKDMYEGTEAYDATSDMLANGNGQEKDLKIEDATLRAGEGLDFELRNVSFSYPGSQTKKEALSNIDLKIKSGQFVVLVGANGSGKSTLLKLLCRLYQPTPSSDNKPPGQVLIDSLPATSYSESSLRRSMAMLSQDNLIYEGFSLGDNIGLGYTPFLSNEDRLHEAAKQGGAEKVIANMKDGLNTVLNPLRDYIVYNVPKQDKDHPLTKVLDKLERPTRVSGGELQRIVAARTFMRLNSGKIRFLAVDEPTSALDAEGEETLLDNLLQERCGKTLIFVTHKFGKLTKLADLVLCMKDGKIIESGRHIDLMKIPGGEYRKLYDIQASPFKDQDEAPPPQHLNDIAS